MSTSAPSTSASRPGDHDPPYVGLANGVELVGEFAGSGYREPPRLVYRADGQVVRLSALLYLLVQVLEEQRRGGEPTAPETVLAETAAAITRSTGRELTGEHVAYLLDNKLAPLGVTTYSDGSPPRLSKANPFLALRFRVAVLPERATWVLGGGLRWLFRPGAIVVTLLLAAASEAWAFGTQSPATALEQTIMSPTGILAVLGIVLASTAFHEIGHATACRYDGVRPGAMGCGIYLVWPAFYTDITNTYRLGRAGRLRADLGGVYFNAVFLIFVTLLYAATGYQPLLVAVLMINVEIIQQLLPTLRFDGYYIVADLVGIPDLFTYIGSILKRTVLRRPPDERLKALKRWPQIIVTAWVLVVIPVLLLQLGYLISRLPYLIRTDIDIVHRLITTASGAANPVTAFASAAIQIVLLALPIAGVVLILAQFARSGVRLIAQRIASRTSATAPDRRRPGRDPRLRLRAAMFALAAVTVFAGAAWTVTTGRTPEPSPIAAPTRTETPRVPSTPLPSTPSPSHRPPKERPSPDQPGTIPYDEEGPAPRTPAGPGRDTPGESSPRSPAPGRSPGPSPTPSPTDTCAVRLPLLPIGLGCAEATPGVPRQD